MMVGRVRQHHNAMRADKPNWREETKRQNAAGEPAPNSKL